MDIAFNKNIWTVPNNSCISIIKREQATTHLWVEHRLSNGIRIIKTIDDDISDLMCYLLFCQFVYVN